MAEVWRNWRKKRMCKKQGKHRVTHGEGGAVFSCPWCGRW